MTHPPILPTFLHGVQHIRTSLNEARSLDKRALEAATALAHRAVSLALYSYYVAS